MDEQTMPQTTESDVPAYPKPALVISVALFVGLFLWGIILSIQEMSQRPSSG